MEDIKESNRIKKETLNNVIAALKKEIPLSEEEIQKIKAAFYSGTEKYLFKRKVEWCIGVSPTPYSDDLFSVDFGSSSKIVR